jgi:hypothetical protein
MQVVKTSSVMFGKARRKHKTKQTEPRQRAKQKAGSKYTIEVPDVIDRASLLIIEMPDMATTQSLQYVSPDVALELPVPISDHT